MKVALISAFLMLIYSTVSFANLSDKMIAECQFDYDDFNFCSKENIEKYKHALATKQPNFDTDKLLLNVGIKDYVRFVAIDTKRGVVFPLNDAISGYTDSRNTRKEHPPIIDYSLNNKELCVEGELYAYRDAYNHAKVCYAIQDRPESTFKKEFRRMSTPVEID